MYQTKFKGRDRRGNPATQHRPELADRWICQRGN